MMCSYCIALSIIHQLLLIWLQVDPASGQVLLADSAPNGRGLQGGAGQGGSLAGEYITQLLASQSALELLQELDDDVTRSRLSKTVLPDLTSVQGMITLYTVRALPSPYLLV